VGFVPSKATNVFQAPISLAVSTYQKQPHPKYPYRKAVIISTFFQKSAIEQYTCVQALLCFFFLSLYFYQAQN
jgi:hypothetical protein